MAKSVRFKKEKVSRIKKDGSEKLSSKPTELRAKLNAPVTLREKMKSLWSEFRVKEEEKNSSESLLDASDFELDDGNLPRTPYECEGNLADSLYDSLQDNIDSYQQKNS